MPEPADVLHREFPYYNNVKIDPRLMGFQSGLSPFADKISAPRLDMYASHINQALVCDGGEWPLIFAGPETNLGDYEFTTSRRDQDIRVVAIIPKYPQVFGPLEIKKNPARTVFYIGQTDGKLHVMELESYTRCSDGFGYINNFVNAHRVQLERNIPQHEKLVTSPIHKDGLYCLGVNANVVFLSREETIEDAIMISQSLADKMTTTEIHQRTITIDANHHPINKYGDDTELKFFPDIDEVVNDDGILAALRPVNQETFASDVMASELQTLQVFHDEIFYAEPGARILDVDVRVAKNYKPSPRLFGQVDKYIHGSLTYWREVIKVYNKYQKDHPLSESCNTKISTAIQTLLASGEQVALPTGVQKQSKIKLLAKNKRPIEFMQITITYMTKRACSEGFKISGRDGNKGIVCKVVPNADMPRDDHGFVADIAIDPCSVIHRMNVGKLYEQGINRCSEFVRRRIQAMSNDPMAAYATLLDYYNDINPNYAQKVASVTIGDEAAIRHVNDAIVNGISLHIPPGLDTIGLALIRHLRRKWDVQLSPVTFTQRDEDGNVIGTFRTKRDACIGSNYLYLLCKIPDPSSPGVAHVNQYHTPMKTPPRDQGQYPLRRNPIRFGEDEHRVITMDLPDTAEAVRLMCLQANSQVGVDKLVETLLTADHPTRIKRIPITNKQLLDSSTIIRLFRHMLRTTGLESTKDGPRPVRSTNNF